MEELARQLGIEITDSKDAQDYALLLKSFKTVVRGIEDGPDYVHPSLEPHPVDEPRTYWKPATKDNPLNAWSHRCNLKSSNPTSGILQGRTIAIKDNISVGGLPTTLGTLKEIHTDEKFPISPIDAIVVSRILAAGAVIRGTSTCESFCASPLSFTSATGPVHHPLLHGYTSGGSSSGSCALVAANEIGEASYGETCHIAIGSDQAGSVRIPACFTGLYGLKPTHGLVPYTGAASMGSMIDHLGPIAANLEDIAALLKVMAGYDGLDSRMTPESPLVGQVKDYPAMLKDFRQSISTAPPKPLRVGLLTEAFDLPGVSPEVRKMIRDSATSHFSAAGASVIEVSIPMHLEGPSIWTTSTRSSMYEWLCEGRPSGYLSYLAPHIEPQWPPTQKTYELLTRSNPAVVNIILSGKLAHEKLGPAAEGKAHRRVFELRAAYDKALEEVDVLVTPCAPRVAMPHPDLSEGSTILEKLKVAVGLTNNTCPFNVTGHPAMNVPCGELPVPGVDSVKLPVGMQVIAKRWNDEGVIMAAALFEEGRQRISTTTA